MTRFHRLLRDAARHGDAVAIRFEDEALSYAGLLAEAEGLAAGFAGLGIEAGDAVATLMDNSLPCVTGWLALSLIGCTDVPINPHYRGELLRYLLADCGAGIVLCDAAYLPQILDVAPSLPTLRIVIVNGAHEAPAPPAIPLADFASCRSGRSFAGVAEAPERVILYTSGTTGPSKGVVHSQASCLVLSRYNAEVMGYGPDDRLLNVFPLFHQNARYTGVVPALCSGATIRLQKRLSTSTFWRTCVADGITAFNYLGSVLQLILNVTPEDWSDRDHMVRRAFGAGAAAAVRPAFEERLGIRLVETYGLSEAPMATIGAGDRVRAGSAGRASALFDVGVVDPADRPVPAGETGEIVLRPRVPDALMIGYHKRDDATVAAFRNLWFHTGDRGRLSPAGDLFFEERQKDSIRRRGENISAWEVESILARHEAVAEAAVYGIADADGEEEVAASIVLRACAARDGLTDAVAFARIHLPAYAVPTLVRAAADLPRTPTEKVRKEELRRLPRSAYRDFAAPPRDTPRPDAG